MWKNHKGSIILTTIITLLPILAGLLLWDQLPDQVAIHFNAAGEPDNWAGRGFAVLGMPAIIAALHLVCIFITSADPKHKNITGKMLWLTLWVCPFISWLCAAMVLGHTLGFVSNIEMCVCVSMGILFMVLGNYLPKCTPNYTIGIKLPWTLNDEGNWNYTHRIGGFSFTIGGALTLLTSFFGSVWLILTVLIAMVVVPLVASYLYYRKHL